MTQVIDAAFLRTIALAPLSATSDKDERGELLVVAGGRAVPGAPLLVGLAGLRVGAGKLQIAATAETGAALGVAAPEAAVVRVAHDALGEISARSAIGLQDTAGKAGAIVAGPGMMNAGAARIMAVRLLAATPGSVVVDAAALPSRAGEESFASASAGRAVLTPHAGEMATMLDVTKDAVLADPLGAARDAATLFQAVVVMKGPTTWVVSPTGLAWRHDGGVPGLGTSGSGDVLAGAIGGFLAQGHPPMNAAAWGVFIHAAAGAELAASVGPLGFLARELLDVLPRLTSAVCGPERTGS